MKQEDFKFTKSLSDKLIRLKHSEAYQEEFKSSEGKPRLLQAVWERLAKDVSLNCSGKEAKIKYNSLYSVFKKFSDESRSGSERPSWRYWDTFQSTALASVRSSAMENVVEMVGEEREVVEVPEDSPPQRRVRRDPSFNELRREYLRRNLDGTLGGGSSVTREEMERFREEVRKEISDVSSAITEILSILKNNN